MTVSGSLPKVQIDLDAETLNFAKLHWELKYLRACGSIELLDASSSASLKTWMVPRSLEQHSLVLSALKLMQRMVARSVPLRTSLSLRPVLVSNTRIKVPLLDAVATRLPSEFKARAPSGPS
eukprot:TRINITY_DN11394_c0_g1_i11.p3 TRINITY_DN11394_c0_g1~~TRINITY_DN11394_c0_g1_i11.p3  ORF type:complete len:122 (-),score=17.67 TRINITY_DN11394_c0_g1_i11:737-1102(-)